MVDGERSLIELRGILDDGTVDAIEDGLDEAYGEYTEALPGETTIRR